MDRFSEEAVTRGERYEGFDTSDEAEDGGPSCYEIANRLGMNAGQAVQCERCASVRKDVVSDRQIRAGVVCCEVKEVA